MKHKEKFIGSINTLLHSWGSETPPEVIWGLNEMIDFLELEHDVEIRFRFDEPFNEDAIDPSVVIDELRSKL